MIARSDSPLARTISGVAALLSVSSVSSRSPVMPMTPFMGVRISWLMLARNSLLAVLARSANSCLCLMRETFQMTAIRPSTRIPTPRARSPSCFCDSMS